MELTKQGMEFWGSDRQIGTIGTTNSVGNPFPGLSGNSTPTPLEDNSLVIKTQGDGKYILVSAKEDHGLVFLGDGSAIYRGNVSLQGI